MSRITDGDRGLRIHKIDLNQTERNIIKALGEDTLKLKELAPWAGYEVSGHLRRTVSSLAKWGILGNKKPGCFVQPEYRSIIKG
ncbi:MAG: hypothetical protein ACYTEK_08440 [Planctomycetota bacterium]|jgi:hypothetical protein